MSQTAKTNNVHKITVKNKCPGQISTGLNTQILIDGQPLKGVTFMKFEFKPKNVTKIVLEMVADISIEESDFENIVINTR